MTELEVAAERTLRDEVLACAAQLLQLSGRLGWGSGDPLADAVGWLQVSSGGDMADAPPPVVRMPASAGECCTTTVWHRPDRIGQACSQTDRAEAGTTVYVMHGGSPGAVLYVGITDTPLTRWRTHRLTKEWWSEVVWIEQRVCSTRDEARRVERELIAALNPPNNSTGPGHRERARQRRKNRTRLPEALRALANRWEMPS